MLWPVLTWGVEGRSRGVVRPAAGGEDPAPWTGPERHTLLAVLWDLCIPKDCPAASVLSAFDEALP